LLVLWYTDNDTAGPMSRNILHISVDIRVSYYAWKR
jgi:hypothetical protein